jgi:hypothetical protein
LSNSLQEIAVDEPSSIPLFLTIDQETGIVNRMNAPATEFPGNMAAGATRSETLTARTWTVVGRELGAVGVNMTSRRFWMSTLIRPTPSSACARSVKIRISLEDSAESR